MRRENYFPVVSRNIIVVLANLVTEMGGRKKSRGGCCRWLVILIIVGAIAGCIILILRATNTIQFPGLYGYTDPKYQDALDVALQFFDVQKSGKLVDNKITWRGDSALEDGSQAKLDLSKGLYDAGDHIKFGFPLAFTTTVLSWAILEYGHHMNDSPNKQLESAHNSLRWITDYLLNAHPKSDVLYIQVGDPTEDHKCWVRPETITKPRPLVQINSTSPGTDVAAETAAAMTAASLVFKGLDPEYSATLLDHAKQLFTFADKHRKSYSTSIPEVAKYYNSTGFMDELLWAASWLYHATGDGMYLDYVTVENGEEFANWGSPTWFSWDDKLAGTQVLLSRISFFNADDVSDSAKDGLQKYRDTAEAVMCGLFPDSPSATTSRTDSGLIWVSEWNSLQAPVASAFLATLYSNYMWTSRTSKLSCSGTSYKPSDLRKFAISQADYVLGNNPNDLSYLVGYGHKYPQYVHHRGASIPADADTGCKDGFKWLNSEDPNPNIAVGALVGGPFLNETFNDNRNNSMQTEPTTYNSALLVGLMSGLITTSSVVKSFR